MPILPTDARLPRCLNVFKPTHHGWFLYWLFFHPSSLKIYLYQADNALLFKRDLAIFTTLANPAYVHLYAIVFIQALLLPSLIMVCIWCLETIVLHVPVSYFFIDGGENLAINTLQPITAMDNFLAMGMHVAEHVAKALMVGITLGVFLGMRGSVAFGVLGGVAYSVLASVLGSILGNILSGIAYGMIISILSGIFSAIVIGMIGIVTLSVAVGLLGSLAIGIAILLGGSRSIFYVWQWLLEQLGITNKMLDYDELLVLPVTSPYAQFAIHWHKSEASTLSKLAHIAANPWQRYQAQRLLWVYYQQQPLAVLYQIMRQTDLQTYAVFPLDAEMLAKNPDRRSVLLAELGGVYLQASGDLTEEFAWHVTRYLRQYNNPRLTVLAAFMFELYQAEPNQLQVILQQSQALYPQIRVYPHGDEVADSLEAFNACLQVEQVAQIPELMPLLTAAHQDEPLRPAVIKAQQQLARVSRDLQIYPETISHEHKLSAIARSLDTLDTLTHSLHILHQPEAKIIQEIIAHWQALLIRDKLCWSV